MNAFGRAWSQEFEVIYETKQLRSRSSGASLHEDDDGGEYRQHQLREDERDDQLGSRRTQRYDNMQLIFIRSEGTPGLGPLTRNFVARPNPKVRF